MQPQSLFLDRYVTDPIASTPMYANTPISTTRRVLHTYTHPDTDTQATSRLIVDKLSSLLFSQVEREDDNYNSSND